MSVDEGGLGVVMGRCLAAWGVVDDEDGQALSWDAGNGVLEDGFHLVQLVGTPGRNDRKPQLGSYVMRNTIVRVIGSSGK